MTSPVVLVVGSLHYDIMVEADHLPRRDETAIGARWFPKFGGKGGNQAAACARHGAAVRFVGAVGQDDFGRFLAAGLTKAGVDIRFLRRIEGAGSGMSVAVQDKAGDYAAAIVSGANLLIEPDWLEDDAVWEGVSLLLLQNEAPEAVNLAAAKQARRRGARVLLNAAPFRPLPEALAPLIDVLIVNAVEAEMMGAPKISHLDDALEAARGLAARFACVIVTAGAQGLALGAAQSASFEIPAEKVAAVSAHGAGDAFTGALAAALLQGRSVVLAALAASRFAALHVSGATSENPYML